MPSTECARNLGESASGYLQRGHKFCHLQCSGRAETFKLPKTEPGAKQTKNKKQLNTKQ